ncbi:conserved Plasmodium protein, unknown function [Plasmodium malariae]|uniref:Uncharacterized protein n=1 Tax=Plasmodium malariae TaxID=5858 RepID=A0A1C3KDT0_PLAMA|nr:conserved Plasmodium protein, unknown function [Plasmodium malariae]
MYKNNLNIRNITPIYTFSSTKKVDTSKRRGGQGSYKSVRSVFSLINNKKLKNKNGHFNKIFFEKFNKRVVSNTAATTTSSSGSNRSIRSTGSTGSRLRVGYGFLSAHNKVVRRNGGIDRVDCVSPVGPVYHICSPGSDGPTRNEKEVQSGVGNVDMYTKNSFRRGIGRGIRGIIRGNDRGAFRRARFASRRFTVSMTTDSKIDEGSLTDERCEKYREHWKEEGYGNKMIDNNLGISGNISKEMKNYYKAAGMFVIKTNIVNSNNNMNRKTNSNNVNVKILLGYDPLQKKHKQDVIENDKVMNKGTLNILGGKKNNVEFCPLETAYREFSEENLFIYNMFLSYFNYLHYVMKNIGRTGGEDVSLRSDSNNRSDRSGKDSRKSNSKGNRQRSNKSSNNERSDDRGDGRRANKACDSYGLYLKKNFLKDITTLNSSEKEQILKLHINNFMLFFKEICLNVMNCHNKIYKCSYPPSYKLENNEQLEKIHEQVSMYNKIKDDNTHNFKLYFRRGKYSLFFFNVIQYNCTNILHHLNNFFWEYYTDFYNIILKENLNDLIKVRQDSKTEYEPYVFDEQDFEHKIDPDLYQNLMNVQVGTHTNSIKFNKSEWDENKDATFYVQDVENEKAILDTGYMNDISWVDLSIFLLLLLKEEQYTQIAYALWTLYNNIVSNNDSSGVVATSTSADYESNYCNDFDNQGYRYSCHNNNGSYNNGNNGGYNNRNNGGYNNGNNGGYNNRNNGGYNNRDIGRHHNSGSPYGNGKWNKNIPSAEDNYELKLPHDLISKINNVYNSVHKKLGKLIKKKEYKQFLVLLFSPFNTQLNEQNVEDSLTNLNFPLRKFCRCLISSHNFWCFLFLNLLASVPK